MPKGVPKSTTVEEGDKVFVINDNDFTICEKTVSSAPSPDLIWITQTGRGKVLVGSHRWAKTKVQAIAKALALATNKRGELTDKLAAVDAAIKKLGG